MNLYSTSFLADASDQELRDENLRLEREQKAIRKARLQLANELNQRALRGTLEPAAVQVVSPEFFVADVEVGGEPAPKRRRFFGR